MPKLPQVKPTPLIKFFSDGRKITIAVHNKSIAPGTFNSILKQAQMDRDTFLDLFKK